MKPKTEYEKIDRILASDDELIPSSGFLPAVMDRVQSEAAAPPPIPFPWKRAVPGMVLFAAIVCWGAFAAAQFILPLRGAALLHLQLPIAAAHNLGQAGWIAVALGIPVLSWVYSSRMLRKSGLL